MKNKFNFLTDFEIRALSRDAMRRQLQADQVLERKLESMRRTHQPSPVQQVKGKTMDMFAHPVAAKPGFDLDRE